MANKFPELADHFSSTDASRWEPFLARIKDKQFREEAKKHQGADWKLKRFLNMVGRHMDSPRKGRKVTGLTGNYRVKYHPEIDRYSCSCPDWKYKRSWKAKGQNSDCKHILAMKARKRAGMLKKAQIGMASNLYRSWSSAGKGLDRKALKAQQPPKKKWSRERKAAFLDDWLLPIKMAAVTRGKAAQRILDRLR